MWRESALTFRGQAVMSAPDIISTRTLQQAPISGGWTWAPSGRIISLITRSPWHWEGMIYKCSAKQCERASTLVLLPTSSATGAQQCQMSKICEQWLKKQPSDSPIESFATVNILIHIVLIQKVKKTSKKKTQKGNKEISIPLNVWPAPADMAHWFIPASEALFSATKDSLAGHSKETSAAAFDLCMHSAEEQTPLGLHWHTGRSHWGECCYICLPLQVKTCQWWSKMIKSWSV